MSDLRINIGVMPLAALPIIKVEIGYAHKKEEVVLCEIVKIIELAVQSGASLCASDEFLVAKVDENYPCAGITFLSFESHRKAIEFVKTVNGILSQ